MISYLGHLQLGSQSNDRGRCEGQREEVAEREPVPKLGEDKHSNDGHHVHVAGAALERNGHVPSARVNDSLGEDGSKLGHDVLVLVSEYFGVQGPGKSGTTTNLIMITTTSLMIKHIQTSDLERAGPLRIFTLQFHVRMSSSKLNTLRVRTRNVLKPP